MLRVTSSISADTIFPLLLKIGGRLHFLSSAVVFLTTTLVLNGGLHLASAATNVALTNPQSPTNQPFGTGGAVASLNDNFNYNPDVDYSSASFLSTAVQGVDIPITAYGVSPSATFMSLQNGAQNLGTDATNFLSVDVSLSLGQSLDLIDFWGRTDYAGAEENRHQNLTISFYDEPGGTSGSGSLLGAVVGFSGVSSKDVNDTPGSAYGRLDLTTQLSSQDRGSVRSFEIDHVGSDTFLLLQEIRAASFDGIVPGPMPVLRINRHTGEMALTNESQDGSVLTLSAYSIVSAGGSSLAGERWQSLADFGDADSGGSVDESDNWVALSSPGSTQDLSEVEAPVGDGISLSMGESLPLGRAWLRSGSEDLSMSIVNENEQLVPVSVLFEGDFLPGDYDANGMVTDDDFTLWRQQYGSTGVNLDADGNLDGVVDAADYTVWRSELDGSTAASLAVSVPEPTTLLITLIGLLASVTMSRRQRLFVKMTNPFMLGRNVRTLSLLASCNCLIVLGFASNQTLAQSFLPTGGKAVRLEKLVGGLNGDLTGNTANTRTQYVPIDMTPLGDGRHLVLTLAGHVRLLQTDGTLAPGAYLDTTNSRTPLPNAQDFTQIGATSIAAHPGFLDPLSRGYGKFYTTTSERSGTGVPADFSLNLSQGGNYVVDSVVNEWTLTPSVINSATQLNYTPDAGSLNDTVSVREILRSQRPGIIHTLADMAFDNAENLLITSGDGGGNAFPNTDGSANGQGRAANSQDPTNIFGSILRIDPLDLPGDTRATGGVNGQYRIPSDNAFATDADPFTQPEFFAYGFRSPYRISVDQQTGSIFVGDVGEASREEVSRVVNGGNYGWGAFEGTRVNDALLANSAVNPIDPMFELFHNLNGQSEAVNVVGGFVYRGSAIPELQGMYVFADTGEDEFTQPSNVLDLYYGDPNTSDTSSRDDLFRLQLELPEGLPDRIWSLAEDENGELLALVGPQRNDLFTLEPGETDGGIWRILPPEFPVLNGIIGDVNQDGLVNGNGYGLPTEDDVAAFVAGWLSTGHATPYEQVTNGDINLSGTTDLADWILLKQNHVNGASLSLASLLQVQVPEPTSFAIAMATSVIMLMVRRRR